MKTPIPLLLCTCLSALVPLSIFSQCAGGLAPYTITYDTTVTGNGNASRAFSFPKFDPSLGTLLSADLHSVVNLTYAYTLENQDPNPMNTHTYFTRIQRTDEISSTALDPSTVTAINKTPNVAATLAPGQHVNYGPANMNYGVSNSVTDSRLINFEGPGNVDFDYETATTAAVSGAIKYGFSFTAAADTMVFSITYRYCANSLLNADLLFFSAIPQSNNNVLLNWRQATINAGRTYNLQVSTDGVNFKSFSTIAENTTGVYDQNYLNNTAKKLFFRVMENNSNGQLKYSNIRMVVFDQDVKDKVNIYPTLYTGGTVHIGFPEKGNWQINLYAYDGRRISASRQQDVYSTQLALPASLINGIYLVETVNLQSAQKQITRMIVQK